MYKVEGLGFGSFQNLGILFSGVPIIRIIVYWGLYLGPPSYGNNHIATTKNA